MFSEWLASQYALHAVTLGSNFDWIIKTTTTKHTSIIPSALKAIATCFFCKTKVKKEV